MVEKEKTPLEIRDDVERELKKYQEQFKSSWKECEDIYYGDIWLNGQYRPFENEIFKVVESEVPVLTDSLSSITANVDDPAYSEQAQNLVSSIEWVLKNQKFPIKKQQLVRNSLISAPGFLYVDYDINACDGSGEIQLEVIPRSQVRLDGSVSFIEDSSKNQLDLYRRKSWLKKRYPKFADKIDQMAAKEDVKDEDAHRGRETQDTGGRNKRCRPKRHTAKDILKLQITYIKDSTLIPVPKEESLENAQKENSEFMEGEAAEISLLHDHAVHMEEHLKLAAEIKTEFGLPPEVEFEAVEEFVEQLTQENPEADFSEKLLILKMVENHIEEHEILAEEKPNGGKPKYPGDWRVIETIEKEVVYDGPSRYKHNMFPVVPWYCYKDNTIYGFGEVLNLVDSQRMSAVMAYKEYKGLQRIANPQVALDKGSGITKDDYSNEDGAIYEISEGSRPPQHIQPGNVSPQISQFTRDRSEKIRDISGITEATEGKMPHPNAAAATVERVQTQSVGRIRLKERNSEHYSMKLLGKMIASNILQFWTSEKVVKLEKEGADLRQVIFNPLDMQDLKYEIDISQGSMAGIDKNAYNAMLMGFLAQGLITLPQFLEVAEIPKSGKLKDIVSTAEQEAQQMQALQLENAQLKAQFMPDQLTEEDQALLQNSGM